MVDTIYYALRSSIIRLYEIGFKLHGICIIAWHSNLQSRSRGQTKSTNLVSRDQLDESSPKFMFGVGLTRSLQKGTSDAFPAPFWCGKIYLFMQKFPHIKILSITKDSFQLVHHGGARAAADLQWPFFFLTAHAAAFPVSPCC